MVISKSFVDVLFILLCGTIVLLTESVQVGSVDTAPAEVGAGGVSEIRADQVRPVVVTEKAITVDEQPYARPGEAAKNLGPREAALLVPGDRELSHHRMMAVWSAFQERGVRVRLAAEPSEAPQPTGTTD